MAWKVFFSLVFLFPLFNAELRNESIVVEHSIVVGHPGFIDQELREYIIEEIQDSLGRSVEFVLQVQSTICLEGYCKIVPVDLHWDILGNFTDYNLNPGVEFEKTDGVPFLDEDYVALREILLDQQSAYKGILYHQITKDKNHGEEEGVDAMSGATQIILGDGQTVVGAALTCFTLWHWANGDVVSAIRRITGAQLTKERLLVFLSKDEPYQQLALNELVRRKSYDSALVDATITNKSLTETEMINLVIDYLEDAPDSIYFDAIRKLCIKTLSSSRIKCLQSLSNSQAIFKHEFFDFTIPILNEVEQLQEMDLILEILDEKELSEELLEAIIAQLNGSIIVARRAYWFLSELELTLDQQKTLKNFEKENEAFLW